MASRDYCENIAGELEVWSDKLHRLSSDFDRIPSIEKYKLQPQIEALHIIMTELDDRLCEMLTSCPTASGALEKEGTGSIRFNDNRDELFDYDFGG